MADFIKTQNSFSNGEVSPEFFACDNINGLSKLENMDVLSSGALSRRQGLSQITQLRGPARLISFSVANGEEYIIAMTDMHMYIYCNKEKYQDLKTPWPYDALPTLQYAQRFGAMIFVHPDFPPYILKKQGNVFDIERFSFEITETFQEKIPFMKFDDAENVRIKLSPHTNGNNFAIFTTSKSFWKPSCVGSRLLLLDKQWEITEYLSPTQAVAYVNASYTMPDGWVTDWYESAFSEHRGWPRSITFHQDRLVFGGTRDWPSGIWMSQVGRHRNFDAGTGLDDEAIFVSLLSQERQQINTLVSSNNLQILTNSGEWAIASKPLTPTNVDIKQHTFVGSYTTRFLPPQKIEGSTVFVAASGRDIRELSLDEIGENYNANDLCAFAKHLMTTPIDIAYNQDTHQLFVVRDDGKMAVLNQNQSLGISAWGTYVTDGKFISVGVCDGITYTVTQRGNSVFLEYFDDNALTDAGGYNFSFTASGLPLRSSGHSASRIKVRKISARVLNTKSVYINQYRMTLPDYVYNKNSSGYSGDVSLNQLGTMQNTIEPLWEIHGDEPLCTTVLSVTVYGWYTV